MSKIKTTAVLAAAVLGLGLAHAASANVYVGAKGGWSKYHLTGMTKKSSFAGGVLAGYNFNKTLAFEGGYTYHQGPKVADVRVKHHVVDVAAKATLPFNESFSANAKAGFAWVKRTNAAALGLKKTRVRPEAGLGVAYNVSPTTAVGVDYTRIFAGSNNSVDTVAATLTMSLDGLV